MKVLLKIYCGETIKQWELLNGLHPVKQFEIAKQQIQTLLYVKKLEFESEKIIHINSNQPDFVSTLYYMAEKYKIPCEIYLNEKLSTLDEVFRDWNRFYDLLTDELENENNSN